MAVGLLVREKMPTPDAIVLVLEEASIDLVLGISAGHTSLGSSYPDMTSPLAKE